MHNKTLVFSSYIAYAKYIKTNYGIDIQTYSKKKMPQIPNGVSIAFARKHRDYERQNVTNVGCWNCYGCRQCKLCVSSYHCLNSVRLKRCQKCDLSELCVASENSISCKNITHSVNCISCRDLKKCSNCWHSTNLTQCRDCVRCHNCKNCEVLNDENNKRNINRRLETKSDGQYVLLDCKQKNK